MTRRHPRDSEKHFDMPPFYNYAPYFTLQPVKDTRERQVELWKDLILRYAHHHRIFTLASSSFPLFQNSRIDRKLSSEAKELILSSLVADGKAEWVDRKARPGGLLLLLWRSIPDWANFILQFVQENGLGDSVLTLEEIRNGDETRNSELEGVDLGILQRALKILEQQGKASMFKGEVGDDLGVKFFA